MLFRSEVCRIFQRDGKCGWGKGCRFSHSQAVGTGKPTAWTRNKNNKTSNNAKRAGRCYDCNETGHYRGHPSCKKPRKPAPNTAYNAISCDEYLKAYQNASDAEENAMVAQIGGEFNAKDVFCESSLKNSVNNKKALLSEKRATFSPADYAVTDRQIGRAHV